MTRYIYIFVLSTFVSLNVNAQCPGAYDCESAGVLCSIDQLDGFRCETQASPNTDFPFPNLCFGTGTPTNLNWWAFVGNGSPLNLIFNFEPASCENGDGIQAGVFEGSCDGFRVLDCNADCNTSTFTLSGRTLNCETYYIWVNGCDGDICSYTLSVDGNGFPPQLPPLRPLTTKDAICPCNSFEVCMPDLGDCEPTVEWTVDGQPYGRRGCIDIEVPQDAVSGQEIEVCLRATIGNPDNHYAICDQDSICTIFVVDSIDKEELPLLRVPASQKPYSWNGISIFNDCITPPCSTRIEQPDGCCSDICQPIEFFIPDSFGVFSGKTYCDLDSNCMVDSFDLIIPNIEVTLTNQNGDVFQTVSDSQGCYSLAVPFGTYNGNAFSRKDSLEACDSMNNVGINEMSSRLSYDYLFQKDLDCTPLELRFSTLTGRSRPRCDGRQRSIELIIYNPGPDIVPAQDLIISMNDFMRWTPFSSDYNILSLREATYQTRALGVGESETVTLFFTGTCGRNDMGKSLCFLARFNPAYVCNKGEVTAEYCEVILDSYDPNDLTVEPHGELDPRYILKEQQLSGTIRYQNTGTDTAYDVRIELPLDWSQFDISTFQLLSSDAPSVDAHLRDDQAVIFNLPDVRLPHEDIDSVGSIGFVRYTVRAKNSIPIWSVIEQQAAIYFDANPPIYTNTESQTIMPPYVFDSTETELCAGTELLGQIILESKTIVDTIIALGPDTVRTIDITAHPFYYIMKDTVMLRGDSLRGIKVNKDTVLRFYLKTMEGCDSTRVYDIDARSTSVTDIYSAPFVYPNPIINGALTIHWSEGAGSEFKILDTSGKKIKNYKIDHPHSTINIEGIQPGVYLYQWTAQDGKKISGQLIRL